MQHEHKVLRPRNFKIVAAVFDKGAGLAFNKTECTAGARIDNHAHHRRVTRSQTTISRQSRRETGIEYAGR